MTRRTPLAAVALALLLAACAEGDGKRMPTSAVSGGEQVPVEQLAELTLSYGQEVYVPVYSHLAFKKGAQSFLFAVNLSIRNTDAKHRILAVSARYYDTDGKRIREFLEEPRVLEPLGTTTIFLEETDLRGGMGANFVVEWRAKQPVTEPIVEAVMIGTREVRTATFRSPGRVVKEMRSTDAD